MAEFLLALAAFDAERRWAELGHASLFAFLHRELGLPKDSAFQRMTAARLIQRYSEVREPLRDGRLTLSTSVEVAKVITPENQAEVLPRYFHLSKREARVVTAELQPCEAAPRRTVVVPVRAEPAALTREAPRAEREVRPDEPPPPSEARAPHPALPPLRGGRSECVTEQQSTAAACRRRSPHGGAEPDARHRLPPVPREARGGEGRALPLLPGRDQGRCSFPLEGGGVCGSTYQLELDHIRPRAMGGPSTVENVRMACKPHNPMPPPPHRTCFPSEERQHRARGIGRGDAAAAPPRWRRERP